MMSDAEVMLLLRGTSKLNRARQVFSSQYATIEQAGLQRRPPGPVEVRRMEFEAVLKIADVLGVQLDEHIRDDQS
jgi:hypothetical protein